MADKFMREGKKMKCEYSGCQNQGKYEITRLYPVKKVKDKVFHVCSTCAAAWMRDEKGGQFYSVKKI
jgi:hypothetical protein